MTPAERSAKMVAAIGLFRHTEATKASSGFARELAVHPMPWPQAGTRQAGGVALADSPSALSESLIEVMFGSRPRRRVGPTEPVDSKPASLDGLEVTEVGPDATI